MAITVEKVIKERNILEKKIKELLDRFYKDTGIEISGKLRIHTEATDMISGRVVIKHIPIVNLNLKFPEYVSGT